ncbi:MAG: hypothetical protein ACYC61_14395 [Isosphaeraceae bacterium]
MRGRGTIARLGMMAVAVAGLLSRRAVAGDGVDPWAAFVVRVVHPDRQAAEVIRLFEGARWADPAAALAVWKQAQPASPDRPMNKPAEAIIAMFNREMVPEWRAFDGAELRIAVGADGGALHWFARVPHDDDGVLGAGITAMRLTYPEDRPIAVGGREHPVARLGRSGVPLAGQDGSLVVVAGSREALRRGLEIGAQGDRWDDRAIGGGSAPGPEPVLPDSGVVFRLLPGELPDPRAAGLPLAPAQAVEALRAMGCRRIDGTACLKDGTLALDVFSAIDGPPGRRPIGPALDSPAVDAKWLNSLPSAGVMAFVSMAVDPRAPAWDRAFALADRIERIDPARARVSPLRVRLNLIAAAAGLKLEADLLPRVRGVSFALVGEANRPGRVGGALVVLHLDDAEVARRIVRDASTRIAAVLGAQGPAAAGDAGGPRAVVVRAHGNDLRLAWGRARAAAASDDPPPAGQSMADVCRGWAAKGGPTPTRVGAFWPGRLWQPPARATASWPDGSLAAFTEDPPAVWWGWDEPGGMHDHVRWRGLDQRVRQLLATLPAPAR